MGCPFLEGETNGEECVNTLFFSFRYFYSKSILGTTKILKFFAKK